LDYIHSKFEGGWLKWRIVYAKWCGVGDFLIDEQCRPQMMA